MSRFRPPGWLDDCCFELFQSLPSDLTDAFSAFVVCWECDRAYRRDENGDWEYDPT